MNHNGSQRIDLNQFNPSNLLPTVKCRLKSRFVMARPLQRRCRSLKLRIRCYRMPETQSIFSDCRGNDGCQAKRTKPCLTTSVLTPKRNQGRQRGYQNKEQAGKKQGRP